MREKKKLDWSRHTPKVPEPIPADAQDLRDLMDDASAYAGSAQGATAPAFDHGMRVFNQLYAHYQVIVAKDLAAAHHDLKSATNALRVATWCACCHNGAPRRCRTLQAIQQSLNAAVRKDETAIRWLTRRTLGRVNFFAS
jgi:hypothetical protein